VSNDYDSDYADDYDTYEDQNPENEEEEEYEWKEQETILNHESSSSITKLLSNKGDKFEIYKKADKVPDDIHAMIMIQD